MWVQAIVISILIKLSQEECNKTTETDYRYRYRYRYSYDYSEYQPKSQILCADITSGYDLHNDIFSNMDDSVESVTISRSILPELHQDLFRSISLNNIKIQANVKVVENNAFKDSNISSITLDFNNISAIGDRSFDSSLIQTLSLQNNTLSVIKANNFLGLTDLKTLNLRYNRIREVADYSFDALSNLEELDLSFNEIVDLHYRLFKKMIRLKRICLNNNFLKAVDGNMFSESKSLQDLNIQYNHIIEINTLNYPDSLLSINASHNHLTSASISNLIKVDIIDISFNRLKKIDGLNGLPSLLFLYLNNNSLDSINYPALSNVKNLVALDLEGTGLNNFEWLKNLTELQSLNLAANDLTHLDFSHFRSRRITTLKLNENSLTEIKNLTTMQYLRDLDLSHNNLQDIKYETFKDLSNLWELHLSHNSIHTLHVGCFRGLKYLRSLHLSHNKIANIEIGTFAGIDELYWLDISHNYLLHLDDHIFHNLRNLEILDISYNNLNGLEIVNVLKQVDSNLNINLIGSSSWNCKSLVDVVRNLPKIKVTEGTFYNVTNIDGIPCNNTDSEQHIESKNSEKIALYLNLIEQQSKGISSKATVFNFFLAVLLIALFLKLFFTKCSAIFKRFTCNKNINDTESQVPYIY